MPQPTEPSFISVKSGRLSLEFQTYPTPEAFDRDAGEPGACLELASRWIIHRDTINEFDRMFAPWVEEFTKIPRAIDEPRTAKIRSQAAIPGRVTPLKEKFKSYMLRVFAAVDQSTALAIEAEALRLSRTIHVNSAPHKSLPPLAAMFIKRAQSWLGQSLDWINEKISPYLATVPEFQLQRDSTDKPTLESLARLMQEVTERKMAEED